MKANNIFMISALLIAAFMSSCFGAGVPRLGDLVAGDVNVDLFNQIETLLGELDELEQQFVPLKSALDDAIYDLNASKNPSMLQNIGRLFSGSNGVAIQTLEAAVTAANFAVSRNQNKITAKKNEIDIFVERIDGATNSQAWTTFVDNHPYLKARKARIEAERAEKEKEAKTKEEIERAKKVESEIEKVIDKEKAKQENLKKELKKQHDEAKTLNEQLTSLRNQQVTADELKEQEKNELLKAKAQEKIELEAKAQEKTELEARIQEQLETIAAMEKKMTKTPSTPTDTSKPAETDTSKPAETDDDPKKPQVVAITEEKGWSTWSIVSLVGGSLVVIGIAIFGYIQFVKSSKESVDL